MGLLSKTYDRYRTGMPRLEDLNINGEPECHARIVFTDSAKAYFLENYQKEKGLELHHLLFNLNESGCEMGLNILNEKLRQIKSELNPDYTDSIPNWNKPVQYILADCDIWFVTREDVSHLIEVYNRFTRDFEWFEIQEPKEEIILPKEQSQGQNEKIPVVTPDPLAFYSPKNGCIVFFIDKINDFCRNKSYDNKKVVEVYNKIFLHELIHSCLDLYPRKDGKISYYTGKWVSGDGKFTEESVDNAIVLKCFKGKPFFDLAYEFINNQSLYYKAGIDLYDSSAKLKKNLKALIEHKADRETYYKNKVFIYLSSLYGYGWTKSNRKKIYTNKKGIRIYLKRSGETNQTWNAVNWEDLVKFDYLCYIIKDRGFLLIPVMELEKLGKVSTTSNPKGKDRFDIKIYFNKDEVYFKTSKDFEDVKIDEYLHKI